MSLEGIKKEEVHAAYGETGIIRKGTVLINFCTGLTQEGYHALEFPKNILASNSSDKSEVWQQRTILEFKGCLLLMKGSFEIEDIAWETK